VTTPGSRATPRPSSDVTALSTPDLPTHPLMTRLRQPRNAPDDAQCVSGGFAGRREDDRPPVGVSRKNSDTNRMLTRPWKPASLRAAAALRDGWAIAVVQWRRRDFPFIW
jgi:hypothetical protein